MAFQCPPDCGYCCTHLTREVPRDEAVSTRLFRDALRDLGVYHCGDAVTKGLSLSNAEAAAFARLAKERGARAAMHPRTYLIETRRRLAVVLDWHFPHVACPFYKDYQCTVYHDRPLVCRAFPVMVANPLKLAPSCPQMPVARAELRVEVKARNAVERAHAALDDAAMRALDRGAFARGLAPAEAARRAKRYRRLALEEYLLEQPA